MAGAATVDSLPIASAVQEGVATDYEVTIDPALVTSDLTDFPVQLRMSAAPQAFWDAINYQAGNVRALVNDVEVPFVATRVMHETQEGDMSVLLPNVSSSVETKFILRVYPDQSMSPRSFTDPLGAGAVYSGRYAVAVLGGHAPRNYGSVGGPVLTIGDALYFDRVGVDQTFASNTHQGIAKDHATGWKFAIDTNRIDAFDETGTLQWTNANPAGDLQSATGAGAEFDHLCDGTVYGNWLVIPINSYDGNLPTSGAYIAIFDVSDGSYITATQITGSPEISGVCWNPDIERLVACTFGVALTQLDTYTLNTTTGAVALDGALPITATQERSNVPLVTQIQGIEYAWGGYYIANDTGGRGNILRMEVTPTGVSYDTSCNVAIETIASGNAEGITRDGDSLLWLIDPSGGPASYTVKFAPASLESAGGAVFNLLNASSGFAVHGISVNPADTFTLSAVARPETNRQGVMVGMTANGVGDVDVNDRVALIHRGGATIDTWNSAASWANPSPAIPFSATGPEAERERHAVLVRTPAQRRIVVDGVEEYAPTNANTINVEMDIFSIGREDESNSEEMHGLIGAAKLAMSDLGNDFLSTEHEMLHEASFATILEFDPNAPNTLTLNSASFTQTDADAEPDQLNIDMSYDSDGDVFVEMTFGAETISQQLTASPLDISVSWSTNPGPGDVVAVRLSEAGTDVVSNAINVTVPAPAVTPDPPVSGRSFTDTGVRASYPQPLDASADWIDGLTFAGNVNVTSAGVIEHASGNNGFGAVVGPWDNDQRAGFVLSSQTGTTGENRASVVVRNDGASDATGYQLRLNKDQSRVELRASGANLAVSTFAEINTAHSISLASNGGVGSRFEVEAVGDAIKAYIDGVEIAALSVTNTTYTGGVPALKTRRQDGTVTFSEFTASEVV